MKKILSFKTIYTTDTILYEIDTNWTLYNLYIKVSEDLNINNFDLLDNIAPFDGITEEKPRIEPFDITIKDYYGNSINFLAIYIRPILFYN